MHIKALLYASISFLIGLLSVPFAVRDLATRLSEGWPVYRATPNESIAIDSVTRTEVDARQPGIMSRFAEFARRALTHDEFTAGHYDPGWRPA